MIPQRERFVCGSLYNSTGLLCPGQGAVVAEKKSLIIVCGGGCARDVIWLARDCSHEWRLDGILDDTEANQGQQICDVPVLGKIDDWPKFADSWFVVAIGPPRLRKSIVSRMESKCPVKFATLVHPGALYSDYVQFGEGSIVSQGCILTTQVFIGRHCLINIGCTISHDGLFGDFCTLAPHVTVSGNVTLGDGVELGAGAVLIEKLSLGSGSFAGAGAVVVKNVPENVLYVGVPARHIKNLEPF